MSDDLTRANSAKKVALSGLVQLSKRNPTMARCQVLAALLKAADATLFPTIEQLENTDREQLVKAIVQHTVQVYCNTNFIPSRVFVFFSPVYYNTATFLSRSFTESPTP
jgi:hypothetical protein